MKPITQTCGWCKETIEHRVMSGDLVNTGVMDVERCSNCGAGLLPFETPDGVARVTEAGDPTKLSGEPCWSKGAEPRG